MFGLLEGPVLYAVTGVLLLAYLVSGAVYRLYFHPLASFPGPKLAALTRWYEGYYDVVKHGQYIFQIGKMHDKYGSIVRVGPNELHILDPDYFDVLYSRSHKHDKYEQFYSMLGNPLATFATIDADTHRARRAALNPFFSAKAISKLQGLIQGVTDRLIERMGACAEYDEPIPLFYAYRCLTVDIISEYGFGYQFGLVDRQDWGRSFYSAWRSLWELSPVIRQFPWVMQAMMSMPRWITAAVNPKGLEVIDMFKSVDRETEKALFSPPKSADARPYPIVVRKLAQSDVLLDNEKSFQRLAVEANSFIAAGFETTGAVLSEMTFRILNNPAVHRRLFQELEMAIPDSDVMPHWQTLEKLPYLGAVVRESLRTSVGAYSRLPRIDRYNAMRYKDYVIPPNSAVGMSSLFIAHNPNVFPDPLSFNPDRWLVADPAERHRLERYLVGFGRGARQCAGMNLAYAELYIVIATIIRRFPHLRLFETAPRDMELVHDYFAGMIRRSSQGLQVKV